MSSGGGSSAAGGGIGFAGALAITFIVLKLTGVIGWPWLWVLAPVWVSVLAGLLGLLVFLILVLTIARAEDNPRRAVEDLRPYEHGPARRWPRR